ncbi:MAG: 4-(cytidine 5'-diphospho)-2-C-methyl-D-erythritol kinase [Actinobacteria bacterium]|nr:4-(cytidine 5'-diphospho)-2-C-methyl-D-erythritol kinase [Actinomycetota bacterium]
MRRYQAPAKLNLALHVSPPRPDGYHPLHSLVQTIEWCDLLTVDEEADEDHFEVSGIEIDPEDNLVLRALRAVRALMPVRPVSLRLDKEIPPQSGLGGGSSDAAATLLALGDLAALDEGALSELAEGLGADVPLFLEGGTLEITGIGERVEKVRRLESMAFAVAVPEFGMSTAEVYRRWDEMEGPAGEPLPDADLPPSLRGGMPLRNDLLPAALALEPMLGEFMAELRSAWETAVALTGSGSACFAFFTTFDEAADAAAAATDLAAHTRGVEPRPRGVAEIEYANPGL